MYEIQSNLFSNLDSINGVMHVCNPYGVMGAGFAKEFKAVFPVSYGVYKASMLTQGTVISLQERGLDTFSMVCMNSIGGTRNNMNMEAFEECLTKVKHTIESMNPDQKYLLAFPLYMGAGLAGGNHDEIKKAITTVFQNSNINLHGYYL